ncbi:MAG TPA: hypothetical protein VHT75_12465, partial [Acidimicrobiales bacterium]|nr:hypothetical protein [Acidimicrobiales bacterium]
MRSMRWWDPAGQGPGDGPSPIGWRGSASRYTPGGRRRVGILAAAGEALGSPVAAVVPLQRHRPSVVLAATVAELVAFVALIATANVAAFAGLIAVSVVLLVVGATNRRQVLALTPRGHVALAASIRGWPQAVAGPADRHMVLPEPVGLGQAVDLGGTRWWVDRSAFGFLRHARETLARLEADDPETGRPGGGRRLLEADGQDDGG